MWRSPAFSSSRVKAVRTLRSSKHLAVRGREDPLWHGQALLEVPLPLMASSPEERGRELRGHVDLQEAVVLLLGLYRLSAVDLDC